MPPGMPATQTRGEKFDDEVLACVEMLERAWASELRKVEFAVEDIPPSEPAPWERGVALGRYFAADPVAVAMERTVRESFSVAIVHGMIFSLIVLIVGFVLMLMVPGAPLRERPTGPPAEAAAEAAE